MRMPPAPRRMADCTARFIARRKATRRSSCWAMLSATSVASISGLRISTMFSATSSAPAIFEVLAQHLDVRALLADDDARAARHGSSRAASSPDARSRPRHAGALQPLAQRLAQLEVLVQQLRVVAAANQRLSQVRLMPSRSPIGLTLWPMLRGLLLCGRLLLLGHHDLEVAEPLLDAEARPRPRAWKRFITMARPTSAFETTRRSTSRLWLFSAFAIALSSVFFTVPRCGAC
jgi:hypothetical protein